MCFLNRTAVDVFDALQSNNALQLMIQNNVCLQIFRSKLFLI
jgi:hypothetical protein